MNNNKVLATFVVAILAASAFTVVGFTSIPLENASAQVITITTSADSHDLSFFGNGTVQVVINDSTADDDDVQETITVDIDANPDIGTGASGSFTVFETSTSSGRFEFFLLHDASTLGPANIDPINTNGADEHEAIGSPNTAQASLIRFGAVGEELSFTSGIYDAVSFDITVGNEEITVDFDESGSVLELDRSTYGSDNIVYLFVIDQDANLNPTEPDNFTASATELNTILFDLEGASFPDAVFFDETGDNTARFEGTVELNDTASATPEQLIFTSEAVEMTLLDIAEYDQPQDPTASTDTSSKSFDIDDEDGEINPVGTLTFGSELKLTLNDNDRNRDSDDDETLDDVVTVNVDAAGGDNETLDMAETDDNTGVFTIDLSNEELRITFLADGASPTENDDILQLRESDITEDIIIAYNDTRDDASEISITSSQTVELSLATGSVNLPEAAGINDDFIFTLTDADLNDNPRTKDSYTFDLIGAGPEYALEKGGAPISDLATLEVEIEGEGVTFAGPLTPLTYTLVETDINSGVFTVELSMDDILEATGVDADDGDTLEITYNDFMDDTSRETSDELAIGEASAGVDFSRTALPIPPAAGSAVEDAIGSQVFTTIVVTDSDVNELSTAEDEIEFTIGTGNNQFEVEIDGDGFGTTIDSPAEVSVDFEGGTSLVDILPQIGDGIADFRLAETGSSTGVFDDELVFVNGGLDTDSWHDLEITITYTDTDGDEESAGFTFRGNDGAVTVDQSSAKTGTVLNFVVEDQDLNLDDDTVEEFSSDEGTPAGFLLGIETEDDEIEGGVTSEQFRETGADTGIFSATFTVGTDIQIAELAGGDDEITQASNILITYNDEVDGTGGGGDEIEVNVPVVTSTGAIQVTPELVGPGTELTVLITDTDLDEDSRSTDNYDCNLPDCDPDSDDFFVSFRSDRTEVGRASPDLEETGPNTGVFEFTLELITDETECENDELENKDAEGGSEPEIGACPGDLISIRYEDEQDGSGRSAAVSAIVEVKSWDPEFTSDKQTYNVGDRVTITVSDPDANRKPDVADSLTDIRVFSDSDRVGEELSALETGRDTGVFRLNFGTSSSTTGGAITVRTGDDVTIEYTDQYPADFEEEEDDKDFTFSVPFGATGTLGSATPSEPAVKDVSGGSVSTITPGQQVVLTTVVTNNVEDELPFVDVMEVRDSSGITVFLAWQTGILPDGGRAEVGLSWIAGNPGDYQVRTFVLSSLNNPQVLSDVKTSPIAVS